MIDAGLKVVTAFIPPFKREWEIAKQRIRGESFIEVFVDTPLEICEERDPKGLYKKAREGKLPNFSGIYSPYEAPEDPDVSIDTGEMKRGAKSLEKILHLL